MRGSIFIACLIIFQTPLAIAQEEAGLSDEATTTDGNAPPGELGANRDAEQDARLLEIEETLSAYKAREAELTTELGAVKGQLKEQLEEKEEAELEELFEAEDTDDSISEPLLEIYGFFDMAFSKYIMENDSAFHSLVADKSSFTISHLNLYALSHMTETTSALMELQFTFLPHAERTDMQIHGQDDTSNEYTDTIARDPYTSERYPLNGVRIVRVQMAWEPVDWFKVLAGRYLTPYGIWNIDHGSPVVIPVRVPYRQLRSLSPEAQTGLQVYGRFFGSNSVFFDYAVTLSNGTDNWVAIRDLNEHKAIGLRLKMSYETKDMTFSIGSYGLYNKQAREFIEIRAAAPGMGLEPDDSQLVRVTTEETNIMDEYILTADVLFKWARFRLQSEFMYYYAKYRGDHPLFRSTDIVLKGGNGIEDWRIPNHDGYTWYGLLAYTLPLEEYLAGIKLTPYYMLEFYPIDKMTPSENYTLHYAGLNIGFNPFVVVKLEWALIMPELKEEYGGNLTSLNAQLAVAF